MLQKLFMCSLLFFYVCPFNYFFLLIALDEAMCRASKEEIYIPFGVGICGHVAKSKETVNLKDAYEVSEITLMLELNTLKLLLTS